MRVVGDAARRERGRGVPTRAGRLKPVPASRALGLATRRRARGLVISRRNRVSHRGARSPGHGRRGRFGRWSRSADQARARASARLRGDAFRSCSISPPEDTQRAGRDPRARGLPAGRAGCRTGRVPEPGRAYVARPNAICSIDGRWRRIARAAAQRRTDTGRPSIRSSAPRPPPTGHARSESCSAARATTGPRGCERSRRRGGSRSPRTRARRLAPNMPLSAIEHVEVDAIRRTEEIATLLVELATRRRGGGCSPVNGARGALLRTRASRRRWRTRPRTGPGNSSGPTCPECSGALWEDQEGRPHPVPLSHGPRVLAREHARRNSRARRGSALGRGRRARGAGAADAARLGSCRERDSGSVGKRLSDEADMAERQAGPPAGRRDGVRGAGP